MPHARLTEARDILLMVDEVQTGNGRTGKLYSYQHFGIQPDVVSTAKGLAGGLPMGACLLGEKAADVLTPGTHGSTFGGNPVCAAAALYVQDRLTDELHGRGGPKGRVGAGGTYTAPRRDRFRPRADAGRGKRQACRRRW